MTLAEVDASGQAAVEELLTAMREGYTGEVVFHFRDGSPRLVKRTETRKLDDNQLDGDRTNGYK